MTGAVRLTLPGPTVSREVTWDAVRAYLRADGWTQTTLGADGSERWAHRVVGSISLYPHAPKGIEFAVRRIAERTAGGEAWLSPGEMLSRIVDGAEPLARPHDERCRLETHDGRCRLAWDHDKRGVPCRTTVAP